MDIVWFDYEFYFDGVQLGKYNWKTQMQNLGIESGKIDKSTWLYALLDRKQTYFAWVVQGMMDFSFLKRINLHFIDNVYAEDHLFGTLLFLQSRNIYVIRTPLYVYRIRPNSSCNFNKDKVYLPKFFEPFCDIFKTRLETRTYYIASSWFIMLLKFIDFIQKNSNKETWIIIRVFFKHYISHSMRLLEFKHDPLNLISKLSVVEVYLEKEPQLEKYVKYRHKLKLTNPKKYNLLKPIFSLYYSIKTI